MSISAIIVMGIGVIVIWGGLTASIIHAMKQSKKDAKG
ncbi:MAG TPA: methionine/alanine import family NSS transporter small subunit [Bacillota bacterium]